MFQDKRGPLWNPSPLDRISNCTHKVSLVKCFLILFSSHLRSPPSSFHMGVKNAPKPSDNKKTQPECHRCPPLRLSHPFSCQIPARLAHNFLKNTLAIISFSAVALPTSSRGHCRWATLVTWHSHGNNKSVAGRTWAVSVGPWRKASSHECGRNHIFVCKKQSETNKVCPSL